MADPIVVLPIPAEKSTTLSLNKWYPIWTTIGAVALTVLDLALQAFGDPVLAPLIDKYMPPSARIAIVAIVTLLARQNWTKRMETAQPIIGSPGEARAIEEAVEL